MTTPSNQEAAAGGIILVLILIFFLALMAVWGRRRQIVLSDGEFAAVEYDGNRTDLILEKGTYLLNREKIRWLKFYDSDWQFEQSEVLLLPDSNRIEITYYLHCSADRKQIWDYVDSGSSKSIVNKLKLELRERLRKWAAAQSEGPRTLGAALEAYDEVRELVRRTAQAMVGLGIMIRNVKVLNIEPIARLSEENLQTLKNGA